MPCVTIRKIQKGNLHLKSVTMIDHVTGGFEIAQYNDKRERYIANLVENTWMSRYSRPI